MSEQIYLLLLLFVSLQREITASKAGRFGRLTWLGIWIYHDEAPVRYDNESGYVQLVDTINMIIKS